MSAKAKAHLYRQLAQLIGSGFHLDRSFALLLGQQPEHSVKNLLLQLQAGVAAGQSLSGAALRHISPLEHAMLSAGERSGRLAEACVHLSDSFEADHRAREAAISALIYPVILAHVGVLLPLLTSHFQASLAGNSIAILPSLALRWGILWVGMLALALLWRWASKAAETSPAVDGVLHFLPWIGKVRSHWALARFCQVFHSGLHAAMHIAEGLRTAGAASRSGSLRHGADSAARAVEGGQTLAAGLASTNAFGKTFVDSMHAAEEAGTLDAEVQRWAHSEKEFAISSQRRAAETLPKVAYLLVVLYVASGIIRFFLGYFGEITRMGGGG